MSAYRRGLRVGATSLALAALLLSAACGGTTRDNSNDDAGAGNQASGAANPDAAIKEGLKIAFLPKALNNPYFTVSDNGGKAAVTEFKGEFKEVGPSEASASSQVSYINTLSQQGMDVIVTSANDPNAICGALNQAKAAGAKIVTFDSDTKPECRQIFVNQVTAEGIAENQVKLISQQIGGEGEIAILSATANATNQNAWIALMKNELTKPEYSKIKLVTVAYGNDDDQKSFQETQGLLQSYPNLKGIISPTTVGVAAAGRYLSGSQYKGKVKLTGLGTPNQMRQYVKDGTVDAFALWSPADLGYLAAYAGAALASGQITGAEGDKFKAGKLGEFTVAKDGVVILGPPTVFDKNNIDQFQF
ncbi:rhamnose ABC transporter substrate-binding protein [Micromonospora parathelypteridis]|uniref:Rhamnose transport system substrate-binding protein n=1 Tax=Micromonospora parathelypteridis TaxID=1839617 RepID=A0A840W7W1_9ACTN|nr:rhamnose ABC transporter substrate-binding protein [Micromonospora parathelypteridis]MBB5480840.1 rhamnose transport system substrate-binding protein [Micromonospora parathelypteridis]GGO21361.1 rhamnose ABC transporter substrate-binding protein [Micromonospora parathelypteridis]